MWPWHLKGRNSANLGIIKMKQKLNCKHVRNSYSDVATATKIRFHFQFPRSPDAPFAGRIIIIIIGWLFNWKLCKFSCRIISNIANYLKYNYFWDGDGIDHDDVIKWKYFPRYWPFVRGIHRSPVNSTHKGQWRGALMFSLICVWLKGWVNNREAGDLRRYRAHYDVTVM